MSINRADESFHNAVRLLKRRAGRSAGNRAMPDLERWASTSVHVPWFGETEYQFRFGSHRLILGDRDLAAGGEAAVRTAEAEFALMVESPLIVIGARFGGLSWLWSSPYNWHFAPPAERTVPARIPLTRASFARLWTSLRIMRAASAGGRPRLLRAAALPPRFTHALHAELHEQAARPFAVKAAERALEELTCAAESLESRIRMRSRSAAVTEHGDGRFAARTTRLASAPGIHLGTDRWLTT